MGNNGLQPDNKIGVIEHIADNLGAEWKTKLDFALMSLEIIIWEYNVNNDLLISDNRNSALIKGLNFEQYIKIHHPQDQEKLRQTYAKLFSGEIDRFKTDVRVLESGQHVWIQIHGIVFDRNDDGTISTIMGLRRNIQDQIDANNKLLESKRQLEEYAIKANLAMNSGDIIMWNYDVRNTIFKSFKPESYMYNGIEKDDFLASIHPDDLHQIKQGMITLLTEDSTIPYNCQVRVNIPNYGLRWVDITATVLERDANGQPIILTGLKRDVTREHELTEELIALRNKADEENRLKSAFLANMSHEIRTPLNAIVGFSNLLAYAQTQQERDEYSKVIETNNNLLLQLINDVLDLSKIEAGKMDFIMSEISINELMYQLQQMFIIRAQSGVKIILEPLPDDMYIVSERNRLTQVLTNFLSNATKFTSNGSITIGVKKEERGLYFYVKDTGKGIAPESLSRVFDRFAKFDKEIQGTGLGLSISHTIIDKLKGQIGVESTLGKGTMFWFSIPCNVYSTPKQSLIE